LRARLLLVYGIYTVAVGAFLFIKGGWMVLADGMSGEQHFAGHITQAHAGSLVGLGLVAIGLVRAPGTGRALIGVLFLANVLFVIAQCLAMRAAYTTLNATLLGVHIFWSVGFGILWIRHTSNAHEPRIERSTLRLTLLITFGLLVMLSGIIWLFAPMKIAAAAAGKLAGETLLYIGRERGVSDLSIALIALLTIAIRDSHTTRAVISALCISNVLLAIAGLLAQLSVLTTPARWWVEGLHVLWAAGFGSLVRLGR
jgi:hypothetical protein